MGLIWWNITHVSKFVLVLLCLSTKYVRKLSCRSCAWKLKIFWEVHSISFILIQLALSQKVSDLSVLQELKDKHCFLYLLLLSKALFQHIYQDSPVRKYNSIRLTFQNIMWFCVILPAIKFTNNLPLNFWLRLGFPSKDLSTFNR